MRTPIPVTSEHHSSQLCSSSWTTTSILNCILAIPPVDNTSPVLGLDWIWVSGDGELGFLYIILDPLTFCMG
jgi:hypothetical protein